MGGVTVRDVDVRTYSFYVEAVFLESVLVLALWDGDWAVRSNN